MVKGQTIGLCSNVLPLCLEVAKLGTVDDPREKMFPIESQVTCSGSHT